MSAAVNEGPFVSPPPGVTSPCCSNAANPTWQQPTWFIDPQNVTGLASDLNSGLDASHPVLTYSAGVAGKWMTTSPTLSQNTTITWLSANTDNTDPVLDRKSTRLNSSH